LTATKRENEAESERKSEREDGGVDGDVDVVVDLEGEDADLRPIDVVEMALERQIPLMLRFRDWERATAMMDDLERDSQSEWTERHGAKLKALRTECSALRESGNRHRGDRGGLGALDLNAAHSKSSDIGMNGGHHLGDYHFRGIAQFMPTATTTSTDC